MAEMRSRFRIPGMPPMAPAPAIRPPAIAVLAGIDYSMASNYSCRVCRVDDELAGYFVLMLAVDEAHLLTIAIAKSHQRQGLGARLLRQAMAIGLAGGATTLLLEVRPSNTKALAMYRHFGFAQIGVRRGYYPAAGGREDALVLTHPLAEVSA